MVGEKFIQKSKMVNGDWVLDGIGLGGCPSSCLLASSSVQRRTENGVLVFPHYEYLG